MSRGGLIVVTRNLREFERVDGLRCEDGETVTGLQHAFLGNLRDRNSDVLIQKSLELFYHLLC